MPGRTLPPSAAPAPKAARTAAGGKTATAPAADAADDDVGLVALHRVRFVAWSPSPVTAVAARPDGAVLAAAREDGEIEAWDAVSWSRLAVRFWVGGWMVGLCIYPCMRVAMVEKAGACVRQSQKKGGGGGANKKHADG
jgi:hypothetical protein